MHVKYFENIKNKDERILNCVCAVDVSVPKLFGPILHLKKTGNVEGFQFSRPFVRVFIFIFWANNQK